MKRTMGLLLGLFLASCGGPEARTAKADLESRLLQIAREYPSYGRVDDENRWTPTLCTPSPSRARSSESDDAATHGRKIYYLFARNRTAYALRIGELQPAGQAIVKEAWHPVPATRDPGLEGIYGRQDEAGGFIPYVERNGRTWTTGEKSGLFVMLKEEGGWVYATLTADGKRVTQAGKIASCIGCHRDARPDSLFGIGERAPGR